ncbi:MAG: LysR substrate-binding domain-containing protein [Sphingobium sp.]
MISAWDGIDEFVAVAEAGSFTAGADAFGSSVTHMSRSIARLESRVQAQLFSRTTRSVRLTDTGRQFLEQCRRIIMDRDEAIGLLSNSAEPHGELRCTCSTTLGERFLMPILLRYCERYPNVQLHVELTDRLIDLIAEGYDLALRTGAVSDGRLISTTVGARKFHTCASPAYLANAGRPASIADLAQHRCLIGSSSTWHFRTGGKEEIVRPKPGWRCNSGLAIAAAAAGGLGICQLPEFYVADMLRNGALELVLPDASADAEPIGAVYPRRRHLPPKTSRLIAMLAEDLPRALAEASAAG